MQFLLNTALLFVQLWSNGAYWGYIAQIIVQFLVNIALLFVQLYVHLQQIMALMESLINKYRYILAQTSTDFMRYLHDQIDWNARLIAILGSRGVGKTTMLLQHIKLHDDPLTSLYISADDLYFTNHRLTDLAQTFFQNGGKKLYIDEVHKYENWSTEIKNIYDFLPQLQIVYTGSSILDLEKGGGDLSRRKLQYYLHGLSFREYLKMKCQVDVPVFSLEDVLQGKATLPVDLRPVALFKEYLRNGYYPFFIEQNSLTRLDAIINQTLENDIPAFAHINVSTALKVKRLLYIIAQSVPFKPNFTKLAAELDISRNMINDLFVYLEKSNMITMLRTDTQGVKLLGKVDKVYLNNTNIAYALSDSTPDIGNIRETAFLMSTRATLHTLSSSVSDFYIAPYTFEVGGVNKTRKQVVGIDNAYVVKDDIEYSALRTLPLWSFGLLY